MTARKRVPYQDMTPRQRKAHCRALIKEVVNVINHSGSCQDKDAQAFRDIISAIRGPDADHTYIVKSHTTALIRGMIGIDRKKSGLVAKTNLEDQLRLVNYMEEAKRNHQLFSLGMTHYFAQLNNLKRVAIDMDRVVANMTNHFIGHIGRAVSGLVRLGLVPKDAD